MFDARVSKETYPNIYGYLIFAHLFNLTLYSIKAYLSPRLYYDTSTLASMLIIHSYNYNLY